MPFADLRAQVLEPDLCATCGACELACPKALIEFDELLPRLANGASDQDCGACQDCLTACPGLDPRTPDSEQRLFGRTRKPDERWLGIWRQILGGRATSPEVFERSASGGSATTLLQAAMRHLELDAVLVMGRSADQPWRSSAAVCTSPEELPKHAQSTYQLAPYLGALREWLVDRPGTRVGMVGIACHVQGLRKLQLLDSEIGRLARDNVGFVLEIGCSSSTKPLGTESIVTDLLGLELDQVSRLRYREGEYPGQMEVRTHDGGRHRVEFWRAVRHFATNKTHRCLACGDWISGLADVSISDGDPNIFDASLGLGTVSKHGRLFVRTEVGERVLAAAVEEGSLEAWPIELSGLNLGLERKRNRRATYERRDCPIPEGPIPGYLEPIEEVVEDSEFLATIEKRRRARGALPGGSTQGLCVGGERVVEKRSFPLPEPKTGQIRIEAACSLVSPGTELHYIDRYRGVAANGDEPFRLGYCSSGYVESVGPGVEGFTPGNRVIAMGWGFAYHAEVVCVPYRLCVRIPAALEFDDAVFANLAATAVHAAHRGSLSVEDEVLVVGAGLVGQLVAQVAAGTARRVMIADRLEARLGTARDMGLEPLPVPAGASLRREIEALDEVPAVSKIFLCVTGDASDLLAEAVELLAERNRTARRGLLICVGRFTGHLSFSVEMGNLDIRYASRCGAGYRDDAYVHGQSTYGAPAGEGTVDQNLAASLSLVERGVIRPQSMDVLRLPFAQAPEAYEHLARPVAQVAALFDYTRGSRP